MEFEAVVIGTGLRESIVAAALAKAGFKVAHVDANQYYGGDQATLTLDEIVQWAEARGCTLSQSALDQKRAYCISLSPSIIPSSGPLISALIASGVFRYGGFKLLERVALYDSPGLVNSVPNSKEDIFKNKQISLVEKRRLMRFFTFAAGEFEGKPELEGHDSTPLLEFLKTKFSLDNKIADTITFALAFCTSASEATIPALHRIHRYLRSSGRYGPSPFLVGHYGGSGEISQGFCRTSAVNGGTYILGRSILSLQTHPSHQRQHNLTLSDLDESLTCDLIISAPRNSPRPVESKQRLAIARCIAIIDTPLVFSPASPDPPLDDGALPNNAVDTAVLIFPPACLPDGSSDTAVHAFVTGEGSLSAPRSKWILYLSMPVTSKSCSSEELLRPYLTATMSLARDSPEPLFTLFYQHPIDHPMTAESDSGQIFIPPEVTLLPEGADAATDDAEKVFREAVRVLRESRKRKGSADHDNGDEFPFWPPMDPDGAEYGGEDD